MMHAEREVNGDCFAHKFESLMRRAPLALGLISSNQGPQPTRA
jgi:hypothetical protein